MMHLVVSIQTTQSLRVLRRRFSRFLALGLALLRHLKVTLKSSDELLKINMRCLEYRIRLG